MRRPPARFMRSANHLLFLRDFFRDIIVNIMAQRCSMGLGAVGSLSGTRSFAVWEVQIREIAWFALGWAW